MDVAANNPIYAFADFRLDPTRRLLLHKGETVTLHPKAFDLLLALVENRDRVLSKNELLNTVWAEQFVEENNLAVQISALRKIFGEKKDEHRFIVTVPGKGYRFVAEVETENREGKDFFEAENGDGSSDKTAFEKVKAEPGKTTETGRRGFVAPLLIVGIGVLLIIGWSVNRFWLNEIKIEQKQLKLSKLTTSGKITNATLTSDGKYAVFAQKEAGGESLWLKQIETGSQTRIAAPQAVEYIGLTVSPDDKYIYFCVFQNNKTDVWIRRMPLIGGTVQEITGIDSGVSVSFAPDGKRFAFTESSSSLKETRLIVAETDGANHKILIRAENSKRKFPTFKANPAAWSPDGNEIACAVEEKNGGMKAGILLINPADGGERFLLEPRFAWIDNLAWTDAENLAFVASETDEWSSQIWTISKKTRAARRITNDLHHYQWLSAAHGKLLTVQQNSISDLQIADFAEQLVEIKPREILQETEADYVAFGADDSIYYVSRTSGKREIWRIEKGGANPSQITSDAQISYGFAVSAANDSIVFSSAREGDKHSLWTADASGGNFRRLTDGDDIAPQISADGKRIVFQRGLSEVPSVWKLDSDNFETTQLVKEHSLKPAISPDGSQIAYYFMDFADTGAWRIGLISTETGAMLHKLSFPTTVNERRMRWHPSGRFLTLIFSAGENLNLMLLPTDGGDAKVIGGLGKGEINSFDWSGDGRQIIFSKSDKSQDAVLLTEF